jgi:acetyltransferase-like isoleucine patch superfamily enzyme
MNDRFLLISPDVKLGKNVKLTCFLNLYGCEIGDDTKIGAFVEIQRNAKIGSKCKIGSHSFICSGVTIGDLCFLGHGVIFVNDNHPRSVNSEGELETETDWQVRYVETKIGNNVSIGSQVTILGGITIADNAMIGAGSVVTKDVPANEIWVGNPARFLKKREGY